MHHEKYYEAKRHFDSCVEYSLMEPILIYPALEVVDVILGVKTGYNFPMGHIFEVAGVATKDRDKVMSSIPYITGGSLSICESFFADNFGNRLTPDELRVIMDENDTLVMETTYLWIKRT